MTSQVRRERVGKLQKQSTELDNWKADQQVVGNSSSPPAVTRQGMRLPRSPSPRITKSSSVGMIEHENATDLHIVDQDDIIGLTQGVKNFSDGLVRLKAVFIEPIDCDEDLRVVAHERLGEVLCTLKNVLQQYPPLNSTELFSSAGTLISQIKSYNYEELGNENIEQAFADAIDQLALAFSSSVSEYLMGDQHGAFEEVKTKSYDNLMSSSQESRGEEVIEEEPVVQLSPEQIDATLMNLQAGLDMAFQRAKAWSKYLKDVMTYIERRAQLEVEYSKNLSRLAMSMKPILTEEGFLPLQSVYCTVFSQDIEYAKTCQATFTLLQTSKFLEPLTARRSEHDKARKSLKDTWAKEVKKMQDAVSSLRKAQSMYITRRQEYDKAKELSQKTESDLLSQSSGATSGNLLTKVDKRKKSEEEAMHKAAEAETTYKACVAEANSRQQDLLRTKAHLLAAVREQLFFSDQTIKKVTVDYFQLLQTVSAPVPVQYHTLCEASKEYRPGSQYGEFVRRLPVTSASSSQDDDFKFEPYPATTKEMQNRKVSTQSNESASSDHQSGEGSPQLSSTRRDKYRVPVKAWGQQGFAVGSDTDSASGSSKSVDSSPSNSPYPTGHRKLVLTGSMEDLIESEAMRDPGGVKQLLAVPGTEQLDPGAYLMRRKRRNTTFGVDFQEQVEHYHSAIPPIISKCLKEVEKRGITVKGIYRVSGVKSTVEAVCQRFEMDPQLVDLTQENPNVISNVLKLYLRQLPEPLLTFSLYQAFIQVGKESSSGSVSKETTIERLHNLVDRLPFSNRKTCGVLMHHLKRIAAVSEQNQMNASNLGIVFGPTLLRPQGGNASLACLVDTPHQTRVVELLIVSASTLFGPGDDHEVVPKETIVEELPHERGVAPPPPVLGRKDELKQEAKKHLAASSSMPLPEKPVEHLIPSKSSDNLQPKTSGEDFSLPGCTNNDKKETGSLSVPSAQAGEGDMCGDLDSQFDDDLPDTLLPDDSAATGHPHLPGTQRGGPVRYMDGSYVTSPPAQRHPRPTTPPSSPNLSSRTASLTSSSSPPVIRVEGNLQEDVTPTSTALETPALPAIVNWVPKAESMFNGNILDSRSPQVYRRTTTAKTQSYPQSSQPAEMQQGSRGSWPPPLGAETAEQAFPSEDITGKKPILLSRSPQLYRNCTSFDHERSKPFPSRSSMTSPSLRRKGLPLSEDQVQESDSEKSEKSSDSRAYDLKAARSEFFEGTDSDNSSPLSRQSTIEDRTSVIRDQTVSVTISKDDEPKATLQCSPSVREVSPAPVAVLETSLNVQESEEGVVMVATQLCPDKDQQSVAETTAQPSPAVSTTRPGSREGNGRPSQPRTVPGNGRTSSKDKSKASSKSHGGPIMGKAGLNPTKTDSPKSRTSSVRTALMSSAARLKNIGKRNPVTLLSYQSESISVPDDRQKTRSARTHSLPESSGESTSSRKSDQTGSKVEEGKPDPYSHYAMTQSDSALIKSSSSQRSSPSRQPVAPPVLLTVGGLRKSSISKSASPSLGVAAIDKTRKPTREGSASKSSSKDRLKSDAPSRSTDADRKTRTGSSTSKSTSSSSSRQTRGVSSKDRHTAESSRKPTQRRECCHDSKDKQSEKSQKRK